MSINELPHSKTRIYMHELPKYHRRTIIIKTVTTLSNKWHIQGMSHSVLRILTDKLEIIQKTLVILIYIFGNYFL